MKFKLLLVTLLLVWCSLTAQDRGGFSFFVAPAPALMNATPMSKGAASPKFLSGVGGVSFDQTALPADDLTVSKLTIAYNRTEEDGNRIVLKINDKNVTIPLYDWELVPIARYSDSPYYSCFTYFGNLADKELEKKVLDNDGHALNYHPGLQNTLLGIRIGYMDLLYMYPFTSDLPMKNGEYVLGAGEEVPDYDSNIQNRIKFQNLIGKIQFELDQQFRSYVICDYNQSIIFSVSEGELQLSGSPYYYCWRYAFDNPLFDQEERANKIETRYRELIDAKISENAYFSPRALYIDSLISVITRYNEQYADIETGDDLYPVITADNKEEKRSYLENFSNQSLYSTLINLTFMMESQKIEFLKEYSDQLSANQTILKGMNPAVWNATLKTMRYSAFFRYIKIHFPDTWQSFLEEIENVSIYPEYETPTVIFEENNELLQELFSNE
ncbi:MAG: hypothetical protein JW798_17530 [Prolixibacteraceae bacterium]|nr:hypothetical protein [Prolixibacteraceae bacterium]